MTVRRSVIGFVALAVALGLGWAVVTLHGVFSTERAEAEQAVALRQRVLERYAASRLEDRLVERLRGVQRDIERALRDPLAPVDGLFSRVDGRVQVPHQPIFRAAAPGESGGVHRAYASLRDPEARPAGEGAWGERLALRNAVFDALGAAEEDARKAAVRAFMGHRLRHVLAPERELIVTLAVLDALTTDPGFEPTLLRQSLHDGLGRPPVVEGLQRTALRHRSVFTVAEFGFLAELIVELSRRGEVPRSAFEQALAPIPPPPVPPRIVAPTLVADGAWFVAPHPNPSGGVGRVDGVRIDPPAEVRAIEDEMRRGALLPDDGALRFSPQAPVPLTVESATWTAAPAEARARWRLKVALLWSCAALMLAVVGLVLVDVRRRRRFVALKSDFVAAVSHELRTPLAAIRLMAETLERRLTDVPRARDYPARIVREVDGLGFLVENLLSFNRVDKGRWVARRRVVSPAPVVHRIREGIEAAFEGPIEWHVEGIDTVMLDADPALFELLLANLMRNAVQHGGEGPRAVSVTAKAGSPVRIRVADDGPGIPPEAVGHIFEPFFRGPGRVSRGSGLGLALCQRIAALHGGRIRLVETGSTGTIFEIELPAAAGEGASA